MIRRRDKAQTIGDRARGISFIVLVKIGGEPNHLINLRSEFRNLGTIWIRKRQGQRHLAEWTIAGTQARSLLTLVLPYLRLKTKQAHVALGMPQPRTRWGVTPEVRETQEQARKTIKELNTLGRGKAA